MSLALVNRQQPVWGYIMVYTLVCLDPLAALCLCSPPDWNTSDSAFLSGEGDHQKTTLSAHVSSLTLQFHPGHRMRSSSARHVPHSPLMGMTGSTASRQSGRLVLSTQKHILPSRRTHLRTGSRVRSSQIPVTSQTSQTNVTQA